MFRAEVETVAALTYQRGLGVAAADTPEQRALVELALERGWFRMYVLSLGGEPVAFWSGAGYDRTFFIGTPGYDPAFAETAARHLPPHAHDRGALRRRRVSTCSTTASASPSTSAASAASRGRRRTC